MYCNYWGFREKPFKLLPNPDFLFLSSTHEEALAHLNYILSEDEGFLMITGEVGTGKSTLCRAFLKELNPSVACAYIFNPKLDALQLLQSINAEFGIQADAANAHELIENLNSFLIDQKVAGKKAIIIIDEAQNLPVESLEQVRLLSNLETTQKKLLHIVLVGQPELAKIIDSFELRQLGQRINLACHLSPLNHDDTRLYIQHRINVASQKPQMPFTKRALRAIYNYSGGVPRLINAACDRMLLAAYLKKQDNISNGLATEIVGELTSRGRIDKPVMPWGRVSVFTGTAALFIGAVFFLIGMGHMNIIPGNLQTVHELSAEVHPGHQSDSVKTITTLLPENNVALDHEKIAIEKDDTAKAGEASTIEISIDDLVRLIRPFDTRRMAAESVLQQWGLEPQGDMSLHGVDDLQYFELIIERHGLSSQSIESNIEELAALDLPAIIRLDPHDTDEPVYLSIIGIENGQYMLTTKGLSYYAHTDSQTLKSLWAGVTLIPWKNYIGYNGVIPGGTPNSAIVILKQLLWEIGYSNLAIDDRYDADTRGAVMEIQAKHGLTVDGVVGNLTKIILCNEKRSLPIPHLQK